MLWIVRVSVSYYATIPNILLETKIEHIQLVKTHTCVFPHPFPSLMVFPGGNLLRGSTGKFPHPLVTLFFRVCRDKLSCEFFPRSNPLNGSMQFHGELIGFVLFKRMFLLLKQILTMELKYLFFMHNYWLVSFILFYISFSKI